MKTCTRCLTKKVASDFYNNRKSVDGLNSWCILCKKEYNQIPSVKQKNNTYQAKAMCDTQKRAKKYKYRNEYTKTNRSKVNAINAKRRASVLQRTPKWLTESELVRIECMYSLASMLNNHGVELWHVDHIIPLQGNNVSGLHVYSNLRVVPSSENLAKGNRYDLI
jgi:5-methylcytosine-specific restriction endonuclease McrA